MENLHDFVCHEEKSENYLDFFMVELHEILLDYFLKSLDEIYGQFLF